MKAAKDKTPFRVMHSLKMKVEPYKKGDTVMYLFIGATYKKAVIKNVSKSPSGEYMYLIDRDKKGLIYETHIFHSDIRSKLEI